MEITWKKCTMIGVSIFILYVCVHYLDSFSGILSTLISAASPIIMGFALAYITNILMSFYESKLFARWNQQKLKRMVSLLMAIITVFLVIFLILSYILPEFIQAIIIFIDRLPTIIQEGYIWLDEQFNIGNQISNQIEQILGKTTDLESRIQSIVVASFNSLTTIISSVSSAIIQFFLAFIFSIYMLLSKETLLSQIKRLSKTYLPQKHFDKLHYIVTKLNESFHHYIVGQCTEAIILGILCTIGMLILGLPYAPMIGSLIGLTALIPIAGAYIGGGIGAVLILTSSPIQAVIFVVSSSYYNN